MLDRLLRPSSIEIYNDLRRQLITAGFDAGAKLKPEELRHNYACAASTMREVLFRLSCDNFVVFHEQRGFRVPESSAKAMWELTEFRILLEQEGAKRSIVQGGIKWEARFAAAHHKLAHIESKMSELPTIAPLIDVWSEAEWEFHETLLSACGSDLLQSTHKNFYDRFRQQQLLRKVQNYGFRPESFDEHQNILDAALTRNPTLCCELIDIHLRNNLDVC
jgi:DNA-binding GntR family transcriptional regulator